MNKPLWFAVGLFAGWMLCVMIGAAFFECGPCWN